MEGKGNFMQRKTKKITNMRSGQVKVGFFSLSFVLCAVLAGIPLVR